MSAEAPPSQELDAKEPLAQSGVTRDEFWMLKREVDGLQVDVMRADRPWYRQASVLISVIALLFSAATTVYANARASREGELADRAELGQLIQRLSALPGEAARSGAEFADNPLVYSIISSSNRAETYVLGIQAADLIDSIPELATANEYYSVAQALLNAGVYDRARELAVKGIPLAKDPQTRISLIRTKAATQYMQGDSAAGRRSMQEALDANNESTNLAEAEEDAYTYYLWAVYDEVAGWCEQSSTHARAALTTLEDVPAGPNRDNLLGLVRTVQGPGGICP